VVQVGHVDEMYLLFPLFEKGTLRDLINRHLASRTPLSEELIVQIFADTCKAVQQFHDKGLAHRDIKVHEGHPGAVVIGSASAH
jgi:serine/threonine protein kinase